MIDLTQKEIRVPNSDLRDSEDPHSCAMGITLIMPEQPDEPDGYGRGLGDCTCSERVEAV